MIDDPGPWDETPLHQAARLAFVPECRALLANGADPNAIDSYGCSPLSNILLRVELMLANGLQFNGMRTQKQYEQDLKVILHLLLDNDATYEKATRHCQFRLPPEVHAWYRNQHADWHASRMNQATAPALAPSRQAARL